VAQSLRRSIQRGRWDRQRRDRQRCDRDMVQRAELEVRAELGRAASDIRTAIVGAVVPRPGA